MGCAWREEKEERGVREAVFEGRDTNRNASLCHNSSYVVSIKFKDNQGQAGLLKNGNIVGIRFHDFKYELSG